MRLGGVGVKEFKNDTDQIWCQKCGHLVSIVEAGKIMETVWKLLDNGIYPYGVCRFHMMENEKNISNLSKLT